MTRASLNSAEHSIATKEIASMPSFRRLGFRTTSPVRGLLGVALAAIAMLVLAAPAAHAAPGPAWSPPVTFVTPTNLEPSASPFAFADSYVVTASNVGGAATSGPVTFTDTLPEGMTFGAYSLLAEGGDSGIGGYELGSCSETPPRTVTCTYAEPVEPGNFLLLEEFVGPGSLTEGAQVSNQVAISGGNAPDAQTSADSTVSADEAPFGFLDGLNGLSGALTGIEGLPETQAGAHPGTLSTNFGMALRTGRQTFPGVQGADGGVRDVHITLPPGVIVDPNATPVRCTEVLLELRTCPSASDIGLADTQTAQGGDVLITQETLYNMVPPPGKAAAFAFDVGGVGLYQHILGGVQAGDYRAGNYAESAGTNDILALWQYPVFGVRVQFWGNPSSSVYDYTRGSCHDFFGGSDCSVEPQTEPVLSNPTSCNDSLTIRATADSWGHPGDFHSKSSPITDSLGNPTGTDGCGQLGFAPTLQARPTTNVADSPSGLSVDLHIPQSNDQDELATAHLRKAVVTLPQGLSLNPASANGLEGCSSAQVGIDPSSGVPDGNQPTCPAASRIGEVEVDTPLLPEALQGSVYVATPHDNPFGSLLAIYIVVNDPATGVLIKLAGHVEADPNTGRLVTTFDENPQLPFEDFKLSFFGGAGGVLRTPAVCGNYSTTSSLTPWSAPESGPPATPSDTYSISQSPSGGSCPSAEAALPDSPSFDAGTVNPIAGAYTPFVMHLSRNDGSQQFASLTLTPPPGLLGKLAGTAPCSDAALAAAANKNGAQEQANPSCPADSRVGTVTVGAGAGPAPYYATGTAYLAGPYKGAPLSIAIVTPAVAGPYDLGTVVVRSAVALDPTTAQITATSDPIPQILQGIPLDVRSIVLNLDKPDFTLNGTSCDPLAVSGSLLSSLNQSAALSQRFQLGECGRLAFKPKLALRLKGGTKRGAHPALTATLTMPPGSANIAKAIVALPHSEFLDQGHIGTVCTRVQFAATECPTASIYGSARATSPLVDYALEGPVYMRSSSHNLPDLVAALHGPASQPIEIDLDGRIDSIHGGIRNSFDLVPDAPVSKFVLSMQGGRKGLLQNSTNLCASTNRATALFDAQNGKTNDIEPALKAKCPKAHRKGKHGHRRHHRSARR